MLLKKNERGLNDHVSIVKGIAIMLMLLGHSGMPWCGHMLSMIRMPIFVIASGYCFKDYYLTHRMTFVRRRGKSLYWPFVKWSAIFVLLHNVFCYLGLYNPDELLYGWCDMLSQVPQILVMREPEPLVGGIWFVRELFFATMLFIAFSFLIKRKPLLWVAIFVAVAVTLNVMGLHFKLRDVSLMAASYYTLGYWVRGRTLRHDWWVILLLLAILATSAQFVPGNFQKMNAAWVVPNYATVMVGAWMVAAIAYHIDTHGGWLPRAIAYVGNHTLIILVMHFLSMRLVSWCIVLCTGMPKECLSHHPVIKDCVWAWPFYFVAGLMLPLAFDFVNKRFWKSLSRIPKMLKSGEKVS